MKFVFDRVLSRIIRRGRLEVTWPNGDISEYGDGKGTLAALHIKDESAEWRLAVNPELALGELYMDERIDFPGDSMLEFICLINENWGSFRRIPWVASVARARQAARRIGQRNDMYKARRNVAHHYDLDEHLYRLFLDSDMQYSCAYFETPETSLEEAQWAKKRHIAAKLALEPGMQVLDIGSGWGGMGLYLAENFNVDVTGVTLSAEQHRLSNQRAKALGLQRRVRFELRDYRQLDQSFDRIVSVGMFEHVGAMHFPEFFRTVERLLKPDGVMLLHAIGRSEPPGGTNPWIEKYIFPGGYIPALSEVLKAIEHRALFVNDLEVLRLHYAETLKAWRHRFRARWDEAAKIYDERFCRMWDFYLAGSEATFRSGGYMVFQIQLTRDIALLPLTRDYIFASEAEQNGLREPESLRLAGE